MSPMHQKVKMGYGGLTGKYFLRSEFIIEYLNLIFRQKAYI